MPLSGLPASTERVSWSARLNRLWPLLLLVVGMLLFFALGGQEHFTVEALAGRRSALLDWVAARPVLAAFAAIGVYAAAVALSLPVGLVLTVIAGLLFGPAVGTLVVVLGATLGATVLFVAARTALGERLRSRVDSALRRMDAGFRDNAFNYMLFLRLVPIFPFWLVNIAPAFTDISLRCYALATVIGIIPGTLVYVLVGNGLGAVIDAGGRPDLNVIFSPQILAPIVGLAALSLVPILVRRRRGRLNG